ncbi:hypothetical protein GCM10009850_115040 [Nonomuraea monospora]|uniref:Uncharacterized protein n=1 Tax=Nonomuraea monospora TaxID=568818 RepID=A0ABN3D2M8_9ACTN
MSSKGDLRAAFRRGDGAEVMHLAEAEVKRARAAGEPTGEVKGL